MTTHPAPLAEAITRLRSGDRSVRAYLESRYERIDEREAEIEAWVGGPKPRSQLKAEAEALEDRHPNPENRPPLYGVPVGVKDIFHVHGLPTRAGSEVPRDEIVGPQAEVVTALRDAGALVLGKTVTTEMAYFQPGPTRNPHDTGHTPGGSSSGSAAAVAAGMCPLALGSQTVGSVIRPAAFCGIVGYKPSYGRIPIGGVLPVSESVDHVGLFTQDVAGMERAADVCVDGWEDASVGPPTLGVPDDEYIEQATEVGLERFEANVSSLEAAGYDVRRAEAFADIERVNELHNRLIAAETAMVQDEWFDAYGDRYGEKTAELITEGLEVPATEIGAGRRGRLELRAAIEDRMDERDIDVWITPSAPGPAPEGIDTTGDPIMNLPWTYVGLPAVTVPSGRVDGLPVGVQCVSRFDADEKLLAWSDSIGDVLAE